MPMTVAGVVDMEVLSWVKGLCRATGGREDP